MLLDITHTVSVMTHRVELCMGQEGVQTSTRNAWFSIKYNVCSFTQFLHGATKFRFSHSDMTSTQTRNL